MQCVFVGFVNREYTIPMSRYSKFGATHQRRASNLLSKCGRWHKVLRNMHKGVPDNIINKHSVGYSYIIHNI